MPISGESRLASATSIIRLGTPSSFCSATFCSNAVDVLGLVEQEQVADLVQVDLLAELLLERLERPQAAQPELDVDRVGELRADAPGRLAGGPGPELVLLDQHHVADPGRGQVVGGAQADDAAADDDDGRVRREVGSWHGHPRFG